MLVCVLNTNFVLCKSICLRPVAVLSTVTLKLRVSISEELLDGTLQQDLFNGR